jgi:hypothetical protein
MQWFKKSTIIETIGLNRLPWFRHVQRMKENRIFKKVLHINLETTRLKGIPRNKWQDEVKEDGRLVGEKRWKESLYTRVMEEAPENSNAHTNGMYVMLFHCCNMYYTSTV